MVIDQRRGHAVESNTDPNALTFHKKVDIAFAVVGKGTGAEEHDDADDEHAQHC